MDLTQQKELYDKIQQQEVVAELGLLALSGADLRTVMNVAVNKLKEVLAVEYTKVLELLPNEKEVILRAGVGWNKNIEVDKSVVSAGLESQAGYTLLSKEPVIVKDLRSEMRFNGPPLLTDHKVISGMSCIIWGEDNKPFGVLGIHTTKKRSFTSYDVSFLQSIANILATAIQRKNDEKKLRESEARKSAILESSRDAIITIDYYGKVVDWNKAAEILFGYSRDEVTGKDMASLIVPESLRADRNNGMAYNHATGEGPVLGKLLELPAQRADGSIFLSELTIARTQDVEPPLFCATMRDITDRKQAEEALKSSEARFRMIADNIPNLCWTADTRGNIDWFNSRWYDYTGTTPAEMENNGWQKCHDPKMLPVVLKKWNQSINSGEPFEMVFPLKGATGDYRPFLTLVLPVKNERGKVIHWFGTNTDVTQLREFERRLQYQKSLLEAQLEASPLGILVISPEGKVSLSNRQFNEMWKISYVKENQQDPLLEEVILQQLIDPKAFLKSVNECYNKQKHDQLKINFLDGRTFNRYGAPITANDNLNYGYVWFFLDITEQEKLAKQKDEFIGIASHELKTPLTSISGFIQLLNIFFEGKSYDDAGKMLHKTQLQIDRLIGLINDLLDVSKIQAGKLEYNFSVFSVGEMINDCVEQVIHQSKNREIVITGDFHTEICGDKLRLEQVLINLLSNAIKYSPESNSIVISVTSGKDWLQISVIDKGIGISPEDLPHIFDRFFRVKQNSFQYQGVGLGLHLSKEIILRHNGKIWAESEGKGQGTTVAFKVPVKGVACELTG